MGLLFPQVLCWVATCSFWQSLSRCFLSLAKGNTWHLIGISHAVLFFFQYSFPSLYFLSSSQKFQLWYFHCALYFISGFVFYFVLFYFLEYFNEFLGVFSASAIGIAQHCPDNVSTVISCSKYCCISYYIAMHNSCQEKGVSNWFFTEKHGYIYLVCYYKYSFSRLWPGEFQAHWGQWKSVTWLQWRQDFHPSFCLFGELELTVIAEKKPNLEQHSNVRK